MMFTRIAKRLLARRRVSLSAVVGLAVLTSPAAPLHAQVTLDQLLMPGGSITVEDKLFDNFTFSGINAQGMINPATIAVTPLTSGNPFADPGLHFSVPGGFIIDGSLPGGMFNLSYDVTVTDPTMLIKDNLVEIGAPAPPLGQLPGLGNSANIFEEVFDPLDLVNPIAQKNAFANNMGAMIIDTADFTPLPKVHVETFGQVINGVGQPPAFIQTFSQTFSQLQVPEPTTLLLWIVAAGAAVFAFRRRTASA